MTAFDTTWALLKSDFYFGSDNPDKEGGFHSTGGWKTLPGSENVRSSRDGYATGVNLNHPYYHHKDWSGERQEPLNEDEQIKNIINTIVHEEGHEAIYNPLVETNDLEFEDAGYEPQFFSESYPEHGAMLIEGMRHKEINAELKRRGYISNTGSLIDQVLTRLDGKYEGR
jgi:hypothetical protein